MLGECKFLKGRFKLVNFGDEKLFMLEQADEGIQQRPFGCPQGQTGPLLE